MSKKLYKVLPIVMLSTTIAFANENVEVAILTPNEVVESSIIEMHTSTLENHNLVDAKLEELEKEVDDLSILLEEVKTEYNSKINKYDLYSVVNDAAAIFNNGSREIFDYSKKVETMNYMYTEYNELQYTNAYFNVSDLRQTSGLSADQFNTILSGTNMAGLGYVFVNIENQYQVNGLFILAIAKQESGLGSSNMAQSKNNVTGYMAYDYNTGAARSFSSFEQCLMETARWIDKNYLSENGQHYNGDSIFGVNIKYCSQIDWSIYLIDIMFSSVEKIL